MPSVTNGGPSDQSTSPSGVEGVTYVESQVAGAGPCDPGPVQNSSLISRSSSLSAGDPDVNFEIGDHGIECILYREHFILFGSGVCCISIE